MQGWRTHHEDAHTMSCKGSMASFWVLDGHGGEGAANFSAPELAREVGKLKCGEHGMPEDEAIEQSFASVDARLREHVTLHPNQDSGSTVVGACAARQDDGTYSVKVLNCGDSRGLVIRSPSEDEISCKDHSVRIPQHLQELATRQDTDPESTAVCHWPLVINSVDHKPSHPSEKRRIEAAGGFVTHDDPPRLDGNLAVSRGVGDFEYKGQRGEPVGQQKVSCVPDIYTVSGLAPGSICILACDGIWDVMSSYEVANFVRNCLAKEPTADLGEVAAEIIRTSLRKNSRDNMTLMIVQFADGSAWANEPDEMKDYDCLEDPRDDELRKHAVAFLNKSEFPSKPQVCSACKRWFAPMMQCGCKQALYCSEKCQQSAWQDHKSTCAAATGGNVPTLIAYKAETE